MFNPTTIKLIHFQYLVGRQIIILESDWEKNSKMPLVVVQYIRKIVLIICVWGIQTILPEISNTDQCPGCYISDKKINCRKKNWLCSTSGLVLHSFKKSLPFFFWEGQVPYFLNNVCTLLFRLIISQIVSLQNPVRLWREEIRFYSDSCQGNIPSL